MDNPSSSTGLTQAQRLLQELRTSFLVEMPDRLDEIESLVLNLEQEQTSSQSSRPVYDELYGHIHSIKGSAGTHGVGIISLIAHQFEDAMMGHDHDPNITPVKIDSFLKHVDLMRKATELAHSDSADFNDIKAALVDIRTHLKQGRKLALIVEGSHFMQHLYQNSLHNLPIDISMLDDGLEALGWLLREKYDLLIMGAETKSLNGTALLYALRAASGINRNIKVIMVTSSNKTMFAKDMEPDTLLIKNQELADQLHNAASDLFDKES